MTAPYMPANATEGTEFQIKWCCRCACEPRDLDDEAACPILSGTYLKPSTPFWIQDAEGPRCTAFVEDRGQGLVNPFRHGEDKARYDALPRDPNTGRPVIA